MSGFWSERSADDPRPTGWPEGWPWPPPAPIAVPDDAWRPAIDQIETAQDAIIIGREAGMVSVCPACGHANTPNIGLTMASQHIAMRVLTMCSACGDLYHATAQSQIDGDWTVVANTVEGSQEISSLITSLNRIAGRAAKEEWTPEQVADAIDRLDPRLNVFTQWLRDPAHAVLFSAAIGFLGVVLMVMVNVFVIDGSARDQHDIPQPNVSDIVRKMLREHDRDLEIPRQGESHSP